MKRISVHPNRAQKPDTFDKASLLARADFLVQCHKDTMEPQALAKMISEDCGCSTRYVGWALS